MAVPQGTAQRQNRSRGMAVEAELVRRFHGGPDHQSRSPALYGKANGRQDDRSQGESRFPDIAAGDDCESDSGGRRELGLKGKAGRHALEARRRPMWRRLRSWPMVRDALASRALLTIR